MYLEKIEEMYNLQYKLNNETTKTDLWFLGYSSNGMKTNWLRYAKMEVSELIESFPIKHWKDINKNINFLNAKVELVDIWHFLLSKTIEEDLAFNKSPEKSIREISIIFNESYKKYNNFTIEEKNPIQYCELFEAYLCELDFCLASDSLNKLISEETLSKFIKVNCALGLSFEELFKLYVGKNCLNQFRQDNGYKENTYQKIWQGKEDNEIMVEIMANLKNITYLILYNELEKKYRALK